jgi:hypothetical protein
MLNDVAGAFVRPKKSSSEPLTGFVSQVTRMLPGASATSCTVAKPIRLSASAGSGSRPLGGAS